MKKLMLVLAGLVASLGLFASLAYAVDFGWSPVTGLEAFHGALISQGTPPVITGTAGCGTLGVQKGGASAGSQAIGTFAASCALTITFPSAAPNGWKCDFGDLTTPADAVNQASSTTTTCVSTAATMVTGDTILWHAFGF